MQTKKEQRMKALSQVLYILYSTRQGRNTLMHPTNITFEGMDLGIEQIISICVGKSDVFSIYICIAYPPSWHCFFTGERSGCDWPSMQQDRWAVLRVWKACLARWVALSSYCISLSLQCTRIARFCVIGNAVWESQLGAFPALRHSSGLL